MTLTFFVTAFKNSIERANFQNKFASASASSLSKLSMSKRLYRGFFSVFSCLLNWFKNCSLKLTLELQIFKTISKMLIFCQTLENYFLIPRDPWSTDSSNLWETQQLDEVVSHCLDLCSHSGDSSLLGEWSEECNLQVVFCRGTRSIHETLLETWKDFESGYIQCSITMHLLLFFIVH